MMTNLARYHTTNLPELMKIIRENGIGMDDYLNRFWDDTSTSNYPPYNLITVSNTESKLEIALAGFKKDEIKVYTEYGKLYVEGNKEDKEDKTYAYRGLAQRSFNRSWHIAEDTIVKDAKIEDGLLTVTLTKVVPEHHQRKDWI